MSTVEPGRKPVENDDNDHLQANGDISSDLINDIEMAKTENKLSTNGTTDKHKNGNANESMDKAEIASSSGTSTVQTTKDEAKVAETIDTKVAKEEEEELVEKPAQSATVTSKSEPQTSNDDAEMVEKPKPSETVETVEPKPIVEPAVEEKPAEIDTTTPEAPDSKEVPEKIEEKTDNIEIDAEAKIETETNDKSSAMAVEEKSVDAAKEKIAMEETVKNTPPTPKRAASASVEEDGDGDDDSGSKNPCAKKIRLDLDASEDNKPEIESTTTPEVDLQKEADILDSISTEIDAQKESELLEEVITIIYKLSSSKCLHVLTLP